MTKNASQYTIDKTVVIIQGFNAVKVDHVQVNGLMSKYMHSQEPGFMAVRKIRNLSRYHRLIDSGRKWSAYQGIISLLSILYYINATSTLTSPTR